MNDRQHDGPGQSASPSARRGPAAAGALRCPACGEAASDETARAASGQTAQGTRAHAGRPLTCCSACGTEFTVAESAWATDGIPAWAGDGRNAAGLGAATVGALLAGAAVPLSLWLLGWIPALRPAFDAMVLPVVHHVILPGVWLALGVLWLFSLRRQDGYDVRRAVALFALLGTLLGTWLAFDAWYAWHGVPLFSIVALVCWRIRWSGWSRCRLSTALVLTLLAGVLCCLGLDWDGNGPGIDNRFGFGCPRWADTSMLLTLLGLLGAGVLLWAIRFAGMVIVVTPAEREDDAEETAPVPQPVVRHWRRADYFSRSLLADRIARDPRCGEYFDVLRRATPCQLPGARMDGGDHPRLPVCAAPGPLPLPAGSQTDAESGPDGGWRRRVARAVRQAVAWAVFPRAGATKDARRGVRLFPDVSGVPPLAESGWQLARRMAAVPAVIRVLRWMRAPVPSAGVPSTLTVAMLSEATQRCYGRYWRCLLRDDRLGRARADEHFAHMTVLYEAWIEARHALFFPPRHAYTVAEAPVRLAVLLPEITARMRVPPSTPGPAPEAPPLPQAAPAEGAADARRAAWQHVGRAYRELWMENVDRLLMCRGLDMMTRLPAGNHTGVDFSQLTCNLLTCRAEVRRDDAPEAAGILAQAADVALWLLASEMAAPVDENTAAAAGRLLDRILSDGPQAPRGARSPERRNPAVPAPSGPAEALEFATLAVATALWRGARGRWDLAARTFVCFPGLDAALQAGAPAMYDVHRIWQHVKLVRALEFVVERRQSLADEGGPAVVDTLGSERDFGLRTAIESAAGGYTALDKYARSGAAVAVASAAAEDEAFRQAGGIFRAWYPDKSGSLIETTAQQALHELQMYKAEGASAPLPAAGGVTATLEADASDAHEAADGDRVTVTVAGEDEASGVPMEEL